MTKEDTLYMDLYIFVTLNKDLKHHQKRCHGSEADRNN